jgi:hypothetical protein
MSTSCRDDTLIWSLWCWVLWTLVRVLSLSLSLPPPSSQAPGSTQTPCHLWGDMRLTRWTQPGTCPHSLEGTASSSSCSQFTSRSHGVTTDIEHGPMAGGTVSPPGSRTGHLGAHSPPFLPSVCLRWAHPRWLTCRQRTLPCRGTGAHHDLGDNKPTWTWPGLQGRGGDFRYCSRTRPVLCPVPTWNPTDQLSVLPCKPQDKRVPSSWDQQDIFCDNVVGTLSPFSLGTERPDRWMDGRHLLLPERPMTQKEPISIAPPSGHSDWFKSGHGN